MSLVQREGKDTQILIRSVEFFTRFTIYDKEIGIAYV